MRHPQAQSQIVLPPSFKRFVLLLAASKGGTGKSTLGSNLAATAFRSGLKTVIFDTDIQVLLGHSKLETTALYTKVSTRTIQAVASPLDRLMALMEDKPPPA